MLPICLVTGFLGTGKTTLLKNIVAKNRDRKIVYLINEFSAHDVDGAIVSAETPDVVSIPGGSIFCHCLVTEFIGQLKKIASAAGGMPAEPGPITASSVDRVPSRGEGYEGVVIEASGMANPKVIEQMLVETKLDTDFRLAMIVSVLDPKSFLKLRHTLPNILAQVEAADVILVNKTDRNLPEKIKETLVAVEELNPTADRIQTVQCDVDLDLFAEHPEASGETGVPRDLQGEYAKCRDPNYETFITERPFDGEQLASFVLENTAIIYRVKGTLADELFDYSTAGVIRTPQPGAAPALAWIIRGGQKELLLKALQALK
jgi:G3E family GTPase